MLALVARLAKRLKVCLVETGASFCYRYSVMNYFSGHDMTAPLASFA